MQQRQDSFEQLENESDNNKTIELYYRKSTYMPTSSPIKDDFDVK